MPDDVMCPITLELMQVPVMAEDGHTYERSTTEDWFKRGNQNSPRTQTQARIGQKLMLNHSMKALIESIVGSRRAEGVEQGAAAAAAAATAINLVGRAGRMAGVNPPCLC
jgi:hypothetical protein